MRNFFNVDAPVIQWVSKISWLLWMNTLWFVLCLPIVTAGAATAALYRMVINIREDKEYGAKAFFRAFRENFKHATLIWLLLLAAALVIAAAYSGILLVGNEITRLILASVLCLLAILCGFVLLYSFPLTCYFENTLTNTLRNALAMSVKHLRQTIYCFALAVIPVIALILNPYWFLRLLYLWVLFYPGFAAYWIGGLLKPVFERYS